MASSKRRVSQTQEIPIAIGGGMFTAGDYAHIPANCSPKIKNMFVRPGPRVEKRPGWVRESLSAGNDYWSRILQYPTSPSRVVAVGAGGGSRHSDYYDGTWHAETAISGGTSDAAVLSNIFYGTDRSAIPPRIWSWDGATFNADAAVAGLGGETMAAFNNRLFVGYIAEKASSLVTTAGYKFEDNTVWTLGGGPPTVAVAGTIRTLTVVGATDTLKTVAPIHTAGASDEYITVQLPFRSQNASADMPFLVSLEDAAGATIYAATSVLVVNKTALPDWQGYVLQALVPAGAAAYLKYAAGTPLLTAVTGRVDIADSASAANVVVATLGRRVYGFGGAGASVFLGTYSYPDRFAWCEVNDVSQWRATSYYDCTEVAGPITAIRELNGQLLVMKGGAIWVFNALDNPSLPVQFVRRLNNVGCISQRAIASYANELYFVGLNDVWRLGAGDPESLAGDGMRETLFGQIGSTTYVSLAVNDIDKEVYTHIRPGKIDVYNLTTKAWSYITLTGADDTELEIADMYFLRNPATGKPELWVSTLATPDIVKLQAAATADNITGTTRDVTAEYVFRPLQTQPLGTVLIESIDIDHRITANQDHSLTQFEVSYDGGATFPNTSTINVAPLAGSDYQPMTIPLWQSHDRMIVGVKHTGAAGADAFNLSGGRARVQVLGPRTQRANPTAVSNTL